MYGKSNNHVVEVNKHVIEIKSQMNGQSVTNLGTVCTWDAGDPKGLVAVQLRSSWYISLVRLH